MSSVTTVFNDIKKLDNSAIGAGIEVEIELVPKGAFRLDDKTEIANKQTATTDSSGHWEAILEVSENIVPADSFYRVKEKIPANQGGIRIWAIRVPVESIG